MLKNKDGITMKQLKDYIKDMPDKNENGEDYEIFIETGQNLSSIVTEIWDLNNGDLLLKKGE